MENLDEITNNPPGRSTDKTVAESEARTIDHYIRHLSYGSTRDFHEVWEESQEGHCESLLNIAMEIVFSRADEELNKRIGYYVPFERIGYTLSNWNEKTSSFNHINP